MCVIMVADDTRPTPQMLEKAWDRNSDGAGAAYRQKDKEHGVLVHWQKGLNLLEIKKLALELPLPYVLHFRKETAGGRLQELTHPFPIDENGANFLAGNTGGDVLFHNGHWSTWKHELRTVAHAYAKKIPDGKYSDTRAMAFIASLEGKPFFDFIEEKVLIFGPTKIEMTKGNGGWVTINQVLCSNSLFMDWGQTNRSTVVYEGKHGGKYEAKEEKKPTCKSNLCMVEMNLNERGYCLTCQRMGRDLLAPKTEVATGPTGFSQSQTTTNGTPKSGTDSTPLTYGGHKVALATLPQGEQGASPDKSPFYVLAITEMALGNKNVSKNFYRKVRNLFSGEEKRFQLTGSPFPMMHQAVKLVDPRVEIIH